MQITRQTEYAIRTLMELSKVNKGDYLQTKVISEKQNIPEVFLKKPYNCCLMPGWLRQNAGV